VYENPQIRAFFSPIPSIRQYFCSNPKPQPHPETEVYKFKGKLVNMNAIVIFSQIVKKATCLMTITQYNSNNSLTLVSFEKINNLDELINVYHIPTEAEERCLIQISIKTQDPNIKTGTIRNPRQNSQLIHDPLCFQNPRIHFLRPNPSIRKLIHPLQHTKRQVITVKFLRPCVVYLCL